MTKIGDVTDGLGFKVGELHTDDSSELAGCLASLIMWLVVAAVALAVWLLVVCVKLTWRLIKATKEDPRWAPVLVGWLLLLGLVGFAAVQPSQPRAGALAQAGTTTNAKVVSAALPSPSLPAIRSPAAPPSSPTPVGSSWFIVGNTEGQGVYVRRTTRLEDKLGAAYPDGARFQEIGPTAVGDGRTWRHVRADDGREGFVPSEYLIVAGPVASPPPGAEREPTSSASDPLKAATDRIGREGYVVRDVQSYDPNALLRVLVGIRRGSDGYDQRAFFFLRERYLGADTWYPSGQISVEKHESTRVILRYALYRPTDANCCASAGSVTVRYNWNGDKLEPLDEIPSADLKATVSRR